MEVLWGCRELFPADFQETKRPCGVIFFISGGEAPIEGVKPPCAKPVHDISSPKVDAIVLLTKPPFLDVIQLLGLQTESRP